METTCRDLKNLLVIPTWCLEATWQASCGDLNTLDIVTYSGPFFGALGSGGAGLNVEADTLKSYDSEQAPESYAEGLAPSAPYDDS